MKWLPQAVVGVVAVASFAAAGSIAAQSPGEAVHPGVCPAAVTRAPRAVIVDALQNPGRYDGWNTPAHPNVPPSRFNTPRRFLTLRNVSVPYHPLFNGVVYRNGCNGTGPVICPYVECGFESGGCVILCQIGGHPECARLAPKRAKICSSGGGLEPVP